jgi:hypothetical protein
MLQELAAESGAAGWAIASMLFFLGVWLAIAVWVWWARPEELEARARLVFEGDEGTPGPKARDSETDVGAPALQGRRIE